MLNKGVEKYPCIEQFQLSEMLNKHFFRLLVSLQSDVEHFPGGIQPFSKSHYGQGSIFWTSRLSETAKMNKRVFL
ncbi:MAG: hypothetical protein WGN25_05240 [Candidatus Electrothrix sp. GW3-4]|uniref:hypothetical protein n=1 Tax=Candidatus Electrothrix sp. GW3-4 TaxID=3126740 RepID=UPI0030D296F7